MANKIAFINSKGGCGKTTSIFHVSGVLAKLGKKVLVIDFDKQKNTTSTIARMKMKKRKKRDNNNTKERTRCCYEKIQSKIKRGGTHKIREERR